MKPFHLGLPLVLVGLFVACGGSDDGDTDNTAGTSSTAGKTGTAGTTGTGTSGSGNGTAGSSNGTSGSNTGTAGTSNNTAGTSSGGTQGQGGNANPAACPATAPMDDDPCTPMAATGGTNGGNNTLRCTYGTERCTCRRDFGGPGNNDGGADAAPAEGSWNCGTIPTQGGNNTGGFGTGGFGTGGRRGGGGGSGGTSTGGTGGTGGTN